MTNIAYVAVVGATIVLNAWATFADFARASFVTKTAAEVHVSQRWLPVLGVAKGAAAIGLLLGLLGYRAVGTAAAAGLVVFFVGALCMHIRYRVFYNIAFPALFLAFAVASLSFSLVR